MTEHTSMVLDPVAEDTANRKRILLIDDDHDQTDVLARALRRQGFDVSSAHSIRDGRAAIDLYDPQLVIMDIRLPDGDGLQLCERMADETEMCQIPVIVLSGMEGPQIVRRARAAGCHFFLRKPYDPNALLVLAESAIKR